MSPTLALTEDLIRRRSVTPEDKGCQDVLIPFIAEPETIYIGVL